eukprot:COSAG01_NODE_4968_length_4584_cov_4.769008_3_plen_75_part_00
MKKQDAGMNLRSHSLDKLRQIITTGASTAAWSFRQRICPGGTDKVRVRGCLPGGGGGRRWRPVAATSGSGIASQ